jgi:hypothetical protein
MFGHVLRGPTEGPAYSSLVFAINTMQHPGQVGRLQTSLFLLIRSDLSECKIFSNNMSDLIYLRNVALNKVLWRRIQFNKDLFSVNEKD